MINSDNRVRSRLQLAISYHYHMADSPRTMTGLFVGRAWGSSGDSRWLVLCRARHRPCNII